MIQNATLGIVPSLHVTTEKATGFLDVGSPSNYELVTDPLVYQTDVINFTGDSLAELRSGSGTELSGYTFKNAFGQAFTSPRGFEMIRFIVERVPDSGTPDAGHPVNITLSGPGLPDLDIDLTGPAEIVFYQKPLSVPDLDGATSNLSVEVPVENQGILRVTMQLKAWKNA